MKAVNEETLLFLTNKVGVLLALLFFTILIPAVNYHLMNVKLEKEKQQHQEYVAQTSAIIETLSGQVTNLTHKYQQSAFFKKEMDCLAKNIYYEAGNQPIDGQTAVAQVTMNRKNANFANSICGVVYQKTGDICQFSWTCK